MSLTETKVIAWIEFAIQSTPITAETWETWLFDMGAEVVTMRDAANQPVFEPKQGETPLWDNTEVVGLFSQEANIDQLLLQLQIDCQQKSVPCYTIRHIANQDWNKTWQKYIKPIHIGKKYWISPPAMCAQITDPHAEIIQLEPGLAFGTGSHQTTRLCLQAMLNYQNKLTNQTVIDYGCGSGILGLTALKLGAQQVIATDISDQALEATQQNAKLNQWSNKQIVTLKPQSLPDNVHAEMLLANILANPLIALATIFKQRLTASGILILSGLMTDDYSRVIQAYQADFKLIDQLELDEWCCLSLEKRE